MQQIKHLNEDNVRTILKWINLSASIDEKIDDLNIRSDAVFSSKKVSELAQEVKHSLEQYIQSSINGLTHLKKEIVDVLPSDEDAKENILYLVKDASVVDDVVYNQYLLIDGKLEPLGDTSTDISNYYTKDEDDAKFETISNVDSIRDTIGTESLDTTSKTLKGAINELKVNFQDGVDTLYDTCVGCGATPTDKTPTAIAEAIKLLAQSSAWWKDWLGLSGISTDTYSSLDDVLIDTNVMNTLMKTHASVDYLVGKLSNNKNALNKIASSADAMQYIGTYDYCADKMLDNATISTVLLASNCWQYILKDHVPTMTSATRPSGEVLASSPLDGYKGYSVFDKNNNTIWASAPNSTSTPTGYLGYRFNIPNCVRKVYFKNRTISDAEGVKSPINIIVQASNDGSNWIDLLSYTNNNTTSAYETYIDIENSDYYLYYRLYMTGVPYNEKNICLAELDFFGRSLNVSVPKMTSDKAPEGECKASSCYNADSQRYAFWAFNGDTEMNKSGWLTNTDKTAPQWIQYKFSKEVAVKWVMLRNRNITSNNNPKTFTIQGSNDGVTFDSLGTFTNPSNSKGATSYYNIANKKSYLYWRMYVTTTQANGAQVGLGRLQFYGVDYSE